MLHAIWDSRTKQEASKAFDLFIQTLEGKYLSAVECLRHRKARDNGSTRALLVMLFKLAQSASRGWRKLRGHQHIPDLIKGVSFIDVVNEQTLKEQSSSGSQLDTTHTEIVA